MTRILIIAGIVVLVLAIGVGIFIALAPSPNAGDSAKLERTFSAEEQARIDSTTITHEELAGHDGQEGRTAWIAVNGIVYDVTKEWTGGKHHGLEAGRDQTEKFVASGHARQTLEKLTVVGTLLPG